MDLGQLQSADGATKKRKRVGRGQGSGHGKTSCRGHKGQKARSGANHRAWFEGGQMPLQRRVPKRGFFNRFRRSYDIVNLSQVDHLGSKEINPGVLIKARLARNENSLIKILGEGSISRPVEIKAHAFSKSAIEKLEAAGGKAILL